MLGYTTLSLPGLSGAGLAVLAATHIISARSIVLMPWFLFLTVHAVVTGVNKIPMCPTVASAISRFGAWLFGSFKFVQTFV